MAENTKLDRQNSQQTTRNHMDSTSHCNKRTCHSITRAWKGIMFKTVEVNYGWKTRDQTN
eukprot:1965911-Amphidinium_carterae.1